MDLKCTNMPEFYVVLHAAVFCLPRSMSIMRPAVVSCALSVTSQVFGAAAAAQMGSQTAAHHPHLHRLLAPRIQVQVACKKHSLQVLEKQRIE